VIPTSTSLKYEPASEPLHIYLKQLFLNCHGNAGRWGASVSGLHTKVQRFQGGLVFKAHRLLHHSTQVGRGPLAGPVMAAAVVLPRWPKGEGFTVKVYEP